MNIGIPKEIRPYEFRVGMSPAGVEMLVQNGHQVYVEHDAGIGAGFRDLEYENQRGAYFLFVRMKSLGAQIFC